MHYCSEERVIRDARRDSKVQRELYKTNIDGSNDETSADEFVPYYGTFYMALYVPKAFAYIYLLLTLLLALHTSPNPLHILVVQTIMFLCTVLQMFYTWRQKRAWQKSRGGSTSDAVSSDKEDKQVKEVLEKC